MADEVINTPAVEAAVEAAPAVTTTPEPVVATPAPEPVVEQVQTEAAKPVEEAKPAETLLGDDPKVTPEVKTEEVKTEETPKTQETLQAEEGQSEEPAPPPVYEDFKAPEGISLDAEQVKEFTTLLSELELSNKIDHAAMQEFGQKAVDFYVAKQQQAAKDLAEFYQKTWEKQKTDWKDSFMSDPDIGGNRWQTTVDSANTFIRTHGGSEEQQAEFRSLMETSGLGNHPAMIRLLANAGRAMSEGKPLAASQPPPQPKSRISTMYGGKQ